MTAHASRGTWHVLENGNVLLEVVDPASGRSGFTQLQASRPLQRHDLEAFDGRAPDVTRSESRWGPAVFAAGASCLLLALVTAIGLVLWLIEPVAGVGAAMFWFGLPAGIIAFFLTKMALSRLVNASKRSQREAGLVPGMADEIEVERAQELMRAHGVSFSLPQRSHPG